MTFLEPEVYCFGFVAIGPISRLPLSPKPGIAGTQWAFYVGNENSNADVQIYKGIDVPTP